MTAPRKVQMKCAHERLMQAATTLFYDHGDTGTGIDAIMERAGVVKMTRGTNSVSNADLLQEYVDARHARWLHLHDLPLAFAISPKQRTFATSGTDRDHAQIAFVQGGD